jgi:hypothetical protein
VLQQWSPTSSLSIGTLEVPTALWLALPGTLNTTGSTPTITFDECCLPPTGQKTSCITGPESNPGRSAWLAVLNTAPSTKDYVVSQRIDSGTVVQLGTLSVPSVYTGLLPITTDSDAAIIVSPPRDVAVSGDWAGTARFGLYRPYFGFGNQRTAGQWSVDLLDQLQQDQQEQPPPVRPNDLPCVGLWTLP